MEKKCYKCGEVKFGSEFYEDRYRSGGLDNKCKSCRSEMAREYRELNKEKITAREKAYREKNKESIALRQKIYREENIDKIKEKERERKKRYYQENEEARKKRNRNTQRYREKRRQYDHSYRVLCNMRNRVHHALKGNSKSVATLELVGCSCDDLVKHMESQFTDGMTWDNYGEWHVDHIRPCASFDLTDPEQQKQCFHYTNLQPLWAEDNIAKGDTWDGYAAG